MADTAVPITAGTGTNIDTRTESTNGNHRQVIVIGDSATNAGVAPVDATNGLTVTSAVLIPGTAATNLGKAEDAVHASGDTGVFSLGVGNEAQSTFASDGDYIAQAVDTKGNTLNVGNIAHDGVDAGAPVKMGGKATNVEPSAVSATGDRSNFITDMVGKQIILPYANPENFVMGTTAAITDTTSTSTIASAGGSLRNYITSIIVTNSHATVGTFVKILDGATIIWEGYAQPLGGGFTQSFPVPLRGTAATAVNTQCVTTGANVIASVAGYKGL